MIINHGRPIQLQKPYSNYAKVIYYQSKANIVEYMVENMFERKITVSFDCTESVEYEFVPPSGKIVCHLDSGEKKYLMKLVPKEKSEVNHLERK